MAPPVGAPLGWAEWAGPGDAGRANWGGSSCRMAPDRPVGVSRAVPRAPVGRWPERRLPVRGLAIERERTSSRRWAVSGMSSWELSMMGRPEPYQPAMRPWMRATSSSVRRRLPLRSALRSRTMSRPGRRTTGSRPGPTCRFQPPRPTTGRSGKTASSRMQEMPLARKLRAEKPQVRRARRYCASECSFHPVWGSAKPERTHSRTSSRLMCAVGTRRWSAQYLATLVLPAPAGR